MNTVPFNLKAKLSIPTRLGTMFVEFCMHWKRAPLAHYYVIFYFSASEQFLLPSTLGGAVGIQRKPLLQLRRAGRMRNQQHLPGEM